MQNEPSGHSKGPFYRTLSLVRRVVHGKPGEKIFLDVPCERCEKARCERLGLRYPQPDWGTAAWFHPPPDTALTAFTRPPLPPPDRVPKKLVRAADAWAAKILDATAYKRPAYA